MLETPDNFFYHYQTLITGLLALTSLLGLWLTTRHQVRHSTRTTLLQIRAERNVNRKNRHHELKKELSELQREESSLKTMLQAELLCNWGNYLNYGSSSRALYLYLTGSLGADVECFQHSRSIYEKNIERIGSLGVDNARILIKTYHDIRSLEPNLNAAVANALSECLVEFDDKGKVTEIKSAESLERIRKACVEQTERFKKAADALVNS